MGFDRLIMSAKESDYGSSLVQASDCVDCVQRLLVWSCRRGSQDLEEYIWRHRLPLAAFFASSSASLLFFLGKCSMVNPRKCLSILRTSARYLTSSGSLASLYFSTWSLMTLASHLTRKLLSP
jgi:hypothetical protein